LKEHLCMEYYSLPTSTFHLDLSNNDLKEIRANYFINIRLANQSNHPSLVADSDALIEVTCRLTQF